MARGVTALGKFRGKVGGQVLRVVKGLQVMQEYNPNPAKSSTIPQVRQRAGMAWLSRFGSALLQTIKVGFSADRYPYSSFIRANLLPAVVQVSTGGNVTPVYHEVKLSVDNIGGNTVLTPGAVKFGEIDHLKVSLSYTAVSDYELSRLKVRLVVYCPELGIAAFGESTATTGAVDVECPSVMDGQEVETWCYISGDIGEIDPEALDQTSERRPQRTGRTIYCGHGEVQ